MRILFCVSICLLSLSVKAQVTISNIQASSEYLELTSQQIAQMSQEELDASRKIFEIEVTLTSTSNVEKVVLMIGSAEGSNDLFYKEFEYTGSATATSTGGDKFYG